jgi:lysophospholipase L1-like esterase
MRRRDLLKGGLSAVPFLAASRASAVPSGTPAPLNRASIQRIVPRLQIVGTNGQLPVNVTPAGTTTGYTRSEGQFKFQIGPQRVTDLRYMFANFYNTTGGELDGIDFTLSASLLQGSQVRWLGIGGNKQPLINAGAGLVTTDPFGGTLDAGSIWVGRAGAVYAGNAQLPGGRQAKWAVGSENYYDSAAGTSQVFSSSSFTQPSGGTTSAFGFGPVAFLGIPAVPHPAVVFYGDSICYGQNDSTDGAGQKGMYEKGMASVFAGSIPMPYANLSRSGDALNSNGDTGTSPSYPNKPRLRGIFKYASDVLITLGTNDLGSTTTNYSLSAMQANLLSIVRDVRAAGARAHVATILPHTTDASNTAIYVPTGSGNPNAFTPGGTRAQYNAGLRNMLSQGAIDGLVDCCSVLEDPLNYGFWVTAGGTDSAGLHPGPTLTALAAPVVNAWAKTLG